MIAAAAASSKMLFNTFDVALVLVLGFGFWRGRKGGMTKEFIPLFRWLFIVIAAGFGHPVLGKQLMEWGVIKQVFGKNFTEGTAAYLVAYLVIAALVLIVFLYVRKLLKSKLEGSSIFGGSEYYLGMVSGVLRYACMTLFALALLHAPHYSAAEIAAQKAYNNRWYGGGMKDFKGDFVPSIYELQAAVFDDSLFGPFIKNSLALMLINTGPLAIPPKPPVIEFTR